MNKTLILILFSLVLTSCFFDDYESEKIKSSTGNYEIKATVNRTNKNSENYADVIINLFDKNNKMLTEFNTGAGDANKWTIGWTKLGDTIVMQSIDIGNKAWIIQNKKTFEIKMTDKLNERAEVLYSEKYD